jgi:hypothetical protein
VSVFSNNCKGGDQKERWRHHSIFGSHTNTATPQNIDPIPFSVICVICLEDAGWRAGGRPAPSLYTGSLPACCYASVTYMCGMGRESEAQLKSILTQNISRTPSRPGIINAAVHCSSRADRRRAHQSPRRTARFLCTPSGRGRSGFATPRHFNASPRPGRSPCLCLLR